MKKFTYNGLNLTLQFFSVVGSTLHGLNTKKSDVDYKAVFTWDKEVMFGMKPYLSQLNKDNTTKEEWCDLLSQLNKEFNLNLQENEDLVLFSAKEFFELSYKNDSNMFDMLYASDEFVLYETKEFVEVKNNKEKFLNLYTAYNRYFGMSHSYLKFANKGENTNKNLAKALQMLYSLELLLNEKKHYYRLPEELTQQLLKVRNGETSFEEANEKYDLLKNKLDSYDYDKTNTKNDYYDFMNNLLVNLHKY